MFSAGGDIKELLSLEVRDRCESIHGRYKATMAYALHNQSPIIVALWNGMVMGGGAGLSIHADIRIATEKTSFAMPEVKIGYICDMGSYYFLRHLPPHPAFGLYMIMTGKKLSGVETMQYGISTNLVSSSSLG